MPSHPAARDDDDDDDTTPSAAAARPKTIIGLAVKEVRQEQQEKGAAAVAPSQEFVEDLVGLLKHFIFAGHDTTSITLCFAFHFLTKKPEAMRQLRAEFDDVFGKEDVDKTPDKLRATPALLNSLPFTTAVIKETLRLVPGMFCFPPCSSLLLQNARIEMTDSCLPCSCRCVKVAAAV